MKLIVTPNVAYPKGVKCNICGKVSKAGQTILWEGKKNVGHTVYHAMCMTELLDSVPQLLHRDQIDAKMEQIATEFAEGNYFNGSN